MGTYPEKDNASSADSEMSWCLRALVRHLADGDPDKATEDKFKQSVPHKRMVDGQEKEFIGGAICTVAGGCVVGSVLRGEPIPGTNLSRVHVSQEGLSHTAVCDEPPIKRQVIIVDD